MQQHLEKLCELNKKKCFWTLKGHQNTHGMRENNVVKSRNYTTWSKRCSSYARVDHLLLFVIIFNLIHCWCYLFHFFLIFSLFFPYFFIIFSSFFHFFIIFSLFFPYFFLSLFLPSLLINFFFLSFFHTRNIYVFFSIYGYVSITCSLLGICG